MYNTITRHHQEGLMFVIEVQNFILLDIWSMMANLTQNSGTISCVYISFFYLSILYRKLEARRHLVKTCK